MNCDRPSESSECPVIDPTTYGDVLAKINEIELKVEEAVEGLRHELFWAAIKTAGIALPILAGVTLWVWTVIKDQAALNGRLQERMEAQNTASADARASQARIEERLNEINRYIREDSRELREALTRHIDGVRLNGEEK